uniref:GH3 domain containing n=1 Tax=Astyanax mexicanus TaxID=7994 RepID=A0A8B9HWU9_ASTMX
MFYENVFCSTTDSEEFRRCHPVTVYDHYRELVQQVSSGEENVLIKGRPLILAMTSGTSGSSNMLLSTKDTSTDFFLQGVCVGVDAMRKAFPGSLSLQRTLKLFYSPTVRHSEGGIPIGPNSSTPTSSKHMLHLYTTPAPAFQVAQEQYLLCPRSMFCEFLPEEDLDSEQFQTLLMHQVEEGKNYELVITNATGLYRYRIGDIVKVAGFHNQCPVVEFLYRRGQMLNVRGEKVSEAMFLGALKNAVSQWPGAKLVDYCCAESGILGDSSGGAQPHYQVFLELKGVRNLTEEQRYKLDCCLQADSAVYRSFRIKGSIGPMRVQLVSQGAFEELKGHMVSFSNTSNTFKMHRVIRKKEYADFLLGKTVS